MPPLKIAGQRTKNNGVRELGRGEDAGGEVGFGLDMLEWRWAIYPSVSCQGPGLLLGPGNPVVTKTDKLPAFVGGPLPTKVCLVKAMVFPVVMYGCEIWTKKKAER